MDIVEDRGIEILLEKGKLRLEGEKLYAFDEKGNIIGSTGMIRKIAYDSNGKAIGYVDKDGTVKDFNGNLIGKMREDGSIVDKKGRIIGKAGEYKEVALDEKGNVIGYKNENGHIVNEKGEIIGFIDEHGNVIKKVQLLSLQEQFKNKSFRRYPILFSTTKT